MWQRYCEQVWLALWGDLRHALAGVVADAFVLAEKGMLSAPPWVTGRGKLLQGCWVCQLAMRLALK